MKISTIIVGLSVMLSVGCATAQHNPDYKSKEPMQKQSTYSKDDIPPLPEPIERSLKDLTGLHDIGYVLVFNKEGTARILRSKDSTFKIFNQGDRISNQGIFALDSIGIVKYLNSHCTGISYRYMDGGVVKEICF